jgi:hypothetical protein
MATTVVTRSDSDGETFEVCSQSDVSSCGPACIFMYECMVRQASMFGGEERIQKISTHFNGNYLQPGATMLDNIILTMQYIGVRVTEIDDPPNFPVKLKVGRISTSSPALVKLGWYNGTTRTSGHYIIAARFNKNGAVVFLDPWKGDLVERMNGGDYINYAQGGALGKIESVIYSG